eukprot:768063-Hanusia_phi.AAC.3
MDPLTCSSTNGIFPALKNSSQTGHGVGSSSRKTSCPHSAGQAVQPGEEGRLGMRERTLWKGEKPSFAPCRSVCSLTSKRLPHTHSVAPAIGRKMLKRGQGKLLSDFGGHLIVALRGHVPRVFDSGGRGHVQKGWVSRVGCNSMNIKAQKARGAGVGGGEREERREREEERGREEIHSQEKRVRLC